MSGTSPNSGIPQPTDVWLELRIHGVHGTSPQSMLGVGAGSVAQVAGDGITGVWRTKDGKAPLRTLEGGKSTKQVAVVEAYSWGGLTSNVKGVISWLTRVFWLALLPFALMNLAYWARPELDKREPRIEGTTHTGIRRTKNAMRQYQDATLALTPLVKTTVVASRIVRIAAAGMTIFLVLAPLTVGVDLMAWQCYREGAAGCPALPGFFDFFTNNFFASSPQRRLVVGAVPALLLVLLLWQLSRQSLARYEGVTPTPAGSHSSSGKVEQSVTPTPVTGTDRAGDAEPARALDGALAVSHRDSGEVEQQVLVLQDPTLWSGTGRTQRLRRLHITLALCTVVTYTSIPVLLGSYADDSGQVKKLYEHGSWLLLADGVVAVLAGLALVVVAVLLLPRVRPGDLESNEPQQTQEQFDRQRVLNLRLVVGAVALTGLHLVFLLIGPGSLTLRVDRPTLLGENVWFVALFLLFAASIVALTMTGRFRPPHAVAGGLVAIVLLVASSSYIWRHLNISPWLSVVGILGSILFGRYLASRRERRAHGMQPADGLAWSGSGPTVLALAAVWIGLLFTTAATTYAANFLNGDQSVADLGTAGEDLPKAATSAPGEGDDTATPVLVASGDVTVHDGRIYVTYVYDDQGAVVSEAVKVTSGSIAVGSYSASQDRDGVLLGRTNIQQAQLVLPDDAVHLDYEHTCVIQTDAPLEGADCSLANGDGRDGRLPAPDVFTVGTSKNRTVTMSPTHVPQATLLLPQVLVWAPLGQLVLVLFIAGLAWRVRSKLKDQHDTIRGRVVSDARIAAEDRKACADARLRALLPHRAEYTVGRLGLATVVISFAVIVGSETGQAPWAVASALEGLLRFASALGLWVALGSALGLVWLASKMRTSGSAARGAGILWDLTTFWPRAAHPLAPPCYAERVVPEMTTRIKWALEQPDPTAQPAKPEWGGAAGVVVSAHSQGSTIAAAVLSRLGDDDLKRVRLITYGSQLRTWYGRIFPAVFGPEALGNMPTDGPTTITDTRPEVDPDAAPPGELVAPEPTGSLRGRLEPAAGQVHWVNLFRRTDPIGFRVFSDVTSDHDRAVLEIPTAPHGNPGPRVMTHGGYQHTPEYVGAVADWTGEALPEIKPPPVLTPPPLPDP